MKILKPILIILLFVTFSLCSIDTCDTVNASSVPTITFNKDGNVVHKGDTIQSRTQILNKFLTKYRELILFVSGIGTLSMILFFILNLIELGNSRGNPQARQKAIHGLIIAGVATAGLGSVMLITQLFYGML